MAAVHKGNVIDFAENSARCHGKLCEKCVQK